MELLCDTLNQWVSPAYRISGTSQADPRSELVPVTLQKDEPHTKPFSPLSNHLPSLLSACRSDCAKSLGSEAAALK